MLPFIAGFNAEKCAAVRSAIRKPLMQPDYAVVGQYVRLFYPISSNSRPLEL